MRNPFSRSKTDVKQPPAAPTLDPRGDGSWHPFDSYLTPDAPAPRVDGVKVETLSHEQVDARAGRLSEAAVEGFAVEAAARQKIDGARRSARLRAELDRLGGSQ